MKVTLSLFWRAAFSLLSLLTLAPIVGAEVLTFTGPQDANGATCVPGLPHCVIGDPLKFQMFSASLTTPATPGGQWRLDLETNYGVPLPGSGEVIPTYKYGFASYFAMCDFLIKWDNKYFAIVMNAHDGYESGSLYLSPNGFRTSGSVMSAQGEDSPRPNLPALLAPGGTRLGIGTLTASPNVGADGVTIAHYHVQATFVAPSDFLTSTNFTVHACSYTCDNGYITGTHAAVVPGSDASVPEPKTWLLALSGCLIVAATRWKS